MSFGKESADRGLAGAAQTQERDALERPSPVLQVALDNPDSAFLLAQTHAADEIGEGAVHREAEIAARYRARRGRSAR